MRVGVELMMTNISVEKSSLRPSKIMQGTRIVAASAGLALAAVAKTPRWDIAWGGTMAAKRGTLEHVDIAALWDRTLSDDVPLSRALRRRGGHAKLMPNLVVPSPCEFTLGGALAFARRQYAMLRLYAPRHWLASLAIHAIHFAGMTQYPDGSVA